MKKILLLSVCFFISALNIKISANIMSEKIDTVINNQLTAQQKASGWTLLFDGKTMNGWRTFKNRPGSWKADNGMLCSSSSDSAHADLISNDVYENFELDVDWKISAQGVSLNSKRSANSNCT
ncbi:MAG TPA: DUF1080 domain-containing protein [Parafilimonas sp.]|jgi:hypothetical protein